MLQAMLLHGLAHHVLVAGSGDDNMHEEAACGQVEAHALGEEDTCMEIPLVLHPEVRDADHVAVGAHKDKGSFRQMVSEAVGVLDAREVDVHMVGEGDERM